VARIRTIKPAFFTSEDVAEVTIPARLLFIGLWTEADKLGRLEYRPKQIKARLFPHDVLQLEPLLDELEAAGLIQVYADADGLHTYIAIPTWERHQRVHPKEPDSTCPTPPDFQKPGKNTASREKPGCIPSSPVGREGKGREGDLGREGSGGRARVGYADPHGQRLDPTAAGFITAGEGQLIAIPGAWATRARHDYGLTPADLDVFAGWAKGWIVQHGFEDGGNRWKWLDARLADWRQGRKGAASSEALAQATQDFLAEQAARRANAEPVEAVLAALKAGYAGR